MSTHSEPWLRWASDEFVPSDQFGAWESALNDSHLPWAIGGRSGDRFSGALGLKNFGDLRVVSCECEPFAGSRSARQISAGDGEYFGALLLLAGEERVRHLGHEMVLHPRSMMIWDSTKDIDFAIQSNIKKVTVFVPQDRISSDSRSFLRHCAEVIDCQHGAPAVMASLLEVLAGELESIDQRAGTSAVDLTVELIASTLEASEDPNLTKAQRDLVTAIETYILDNLADTELTPEVIARHFFVSTRYLHLLFARSDRTVCRFIVEHRLDRARWELGRTAAQGESITRIAGRNGFDDPAHFSRLFKQRFGAAPRDFRKEMTRS
jgi:AraC family transcriptional regulator, positive regulator of tynA and feaB